MVDANASPAKELREIYEGLPGNVIYSMELRFILNEKTRMLQNIRHMVHEVHRAAAIGTSEPRLRPRGSTSTNALGFRIELQQSWTSCTNSPPRKVVPSNGSK